MSYIPWYFLALSELVSTPNKIELGNAIIIMEQIASGAVHNAIIALHNNAEY